MKEKFPDCNKSHPYIKESDGVKKMVGASALAFKGIDKGTSTSVDKNGVGGSWKNSGPGK